MTERMVYTGQFYRHFKNKLYQIITVATHSENGELMVVYQALYGDFRAYVRPLAMFLEEVDHDKYPEVTQKYRFEQVNFAGQNPDCGGCMQVTAASEPLPHKGLMRFLDAETYEEKAACLNELAKTAGQAEVDSLYLVMDMKPHPGTIADQVDNIRRYLDVQKRFDGGHLR